jgi:eukaryotic-like serine/threonine-protein kinase
LATSAAFPVEPRFQIIRQLGTGGMGEVWLAHDSTLERDVVLKRPIRSDRSGPESKRLLTEARRAASVNHPNIAQIHDVIVRGEEVLIVMEHVNGRTLRTSLPEPCSLEQFFPVAKQLCRGLAAAHAQHVIHCDIKPGNIMITAEGDVKILDFGIARARLHPDETIPLSDISAPQSGTPGYMAPEVLRQDEVGERADIFSLGVVFYELLTGVAPFHGISRRDTIERTMNHNPAQLAKYATTVPAELERLVLRMLAKRPTDRAVSVSDVLRDLEQIEKVYEERTIVDPDHWWRVLQGQTAKRARQRLYAGIILILLLSPVGIWVGRKIVARGQAAPRTGVVAVIPFHVIGNDKESIAFAEGLRETLTSKLTQVAAAHGLQLTSASEVARSKIDSARTARSELGADYVVEGSLHRTGNVVRITYALVETKTLQELASETVTAAVSDPFTLEDKVVDGMLGLLNVQLLPNEREAVQQRGTNNPGVYQLYLEGTGLLDRFDAPENIDAAIRKFHQALTADSNYAPAYAGLGRAYGLQYEHTHNSLLIDTGRQACERAISINPSLPESHVCVATFKSMRGDDSHAAEEFQRALLLDPGNDEALRGLALSYERLGRPTDAEETFKKSIAARPQYWRGYSLLAAFYTSKARYDDAVAQLKRAAEQSPHNARVLRSLGGVYIFEGNYSAAIDALQKSIEIYPDASAYSNLGQAYFHQRNYPAAIDAFEKGNLIGAQSSTNSASLGDAYFWAGDVAHASQAYARAIELAEQQLAVDNSDADAHMIVAYANAALGKRKPALRHVAAFLNSHGDDPEALFYAARVYQRLNKTSEALDWLRKAIALGYSRADIDASPEFDSVRNDERFLAALAPRGDGPRH